MALGSLMITESVTQSIGFKESGRSKTQKMQKNNYQFVTPFRKVIVKTGSTTRRLQDLSLYILATYLDLTEHTFHSIEYYPHSLILQDHLVLG